jgi:hypothetical protein
MIDLTGRDPSHLPLDFIEEGGDRKAVLAEPSQAKEVIKIDLKTFWGLMEILRKEQIALLKIGEIEFSFIYERTYALISAIRLGVSTKLKCSIPRGGLKDQVLILHQAGDIFLDRGKDAPGHQIQLYPLPDQKIRMKLSDLDKNL